MLLDHDEEPPLQVAPPAPPPGVPDTERLDALEREGHSLMTYGPGRWDAGWGVKPNPRDAIDAMTSDFCNALRPDDGKDADGHRSHFHKIGHLAIHEP